jgi:hypothetical protein
MGNLIWKRLRALGEMMAFNDTMKKLEAVLTNVTKDLEKVKKGNKSAAQRVRVRTIELEKVAKDFRKESLDKKQK